MFLIQYLQQHLNLSRRKITGLIDQGLIFLNDKKVENYKEDIKKGDNLLVNGKSYVVKDGVSQKDLIMFHKPKGYVCSKSDEFNKTIYTILPEQYKNYYYIGRLDKESSGLLLLTNDTALVHQMEHPSFGVEKEYIVILDRNFDQRDSQRLIDGVEDEGDILKCLDVEVIANLNAQKEPPISPLQRGKVLKIILGEGKKRHIRRMLRELGYRILDLIRIREGEYMLGDLKEGETKKIA